MEPRASLGIVVLQQVAGVETNCYLLYDKVSLDAAVIDVAGPIDALLAEVHRQALHVRYFLFTHGHLDHVVGLPAIRRSYPDALVCMHALDFEDMQTQQEWARRQFAEKPPAWWVKVPEYSELLSFDVATFGKPDLFLEDGDVVRLGTCAIRVLHCPGHSRGSLCYSVCGLLFSGDVLLKGVVGRVDIQNGSKPDQIASVRRLYRDLRDSTVVYPGHGASTTIGDERVGNRCVTETEVQLL